MSTPKVREFAALGRQAEQRGTKRKRFEDSGSEEKEVAEPVGPANKRRRFSTYREQTPDKGLLEDIQSFVNTLEHRRQEALDNGDTGTPHQLNLLVTFTTS
ncbi:hypothetical protein ACJ73_05041 [Blastomyces percursus]|uniref:Uncharacterized protein n=1 Tax=Blastomyces percursus TaxID=1658174 RepID=A0A1J9R7I6_9EURO|nr:hypothetical protein ACJ73_05041 [Blastomyces percursus]